MKVIRLGLVGVWLGLLGACVTTSEGPAATNIDQPKAMNAYINAANQYLQVRDAENALRHLRKASELNIKDARVDAGMAYAFELTGDTALAEEHYKRAIKTGGNEVTRARNNYASFLYQQRRFKEAKIQLEKVTADVLYMRRSLAFTSLGLVNLHLGFTDDAEAAFNRAISIDRRNVLASLELADILLDKKDFRGASRHYGTYQYLSQRPSAKGLLVGIKLAKVTGNTDSAASDALKLKNMFPASPEYAEYSRLYKK